MNCIRYRITLSEPALLTSLEGDPNESISFNYIPGSVLRGIVIGKYIKKYRRDSGSLEAADKVARRLFFNGSTRYLNGYPLDRLDRRALPVPHSWCQGKDAIAVQQEGNLAPVYDFAVSDETSEVEQPQGVKMPFFSFIDGSACFISPAKQLSIHTARNRRFGRALAHRPGFEQKFAGAVYRYEALAAGQIFEALILCENETDVEKLLDILEGDLYLGGSRKAGYGRAKINDAELIGKNWREAGGELTLKKSGILTVTLLSDTLLRDENGQSTSAPSSVAFLLKNKLGINRLRLIKAFTSNKIIGGFNRKWGLPLPQSRALGKGSVLIFKNGGDDGQLLNRLKQIESEGIGERRAEGFGRLAFNWHHQERIPVSTADGGDHLGADKIKEKESKRLAGLMATRLFEKRLENKMVKKVNELAKFLEGKNLPSNAQLSRLRGVIAEALTREESH
jgi:CRISPR-associated protein Csx10